MNHHVTIQASRLVNLYINLVPRGHRRMNDQGPTFGGKLAGSAVHRSAIVANVAANVVASKKLSFLE